MSESVRVAVDVVAGVVPGTPMPEYSRRYYITSAEWHAAADTPEGQATLLAEMNGKAQGWASYLMLQPDALNWVRTDWVWF